jgi:hypothetical protein
MDVIVAPNVEQGDSLIVDAERYGDAIRIG